MPDNVAVAGAAAAGAVAAEKPADPAWTDASPTAALALPGIRPQPTAGAPGDGPPARKKRRGKARRRSKASLASLKKHALAAGAAGAAGTAGADGTDGAGGGGRDAAACAAPGVATRAGDVAFAAFMASLESQPGTISDRLNREHAHFDAELAAAWGSGLLGKKQRRALAAASMRRIEAETRATRELRYNFAANPDDHCETSAEAYMDIAPLLRRYAAALGKAPGDLRIYDPYFCAGAVKRNLAAVGFPTVYNENEDFYKQIATGRVPEYDVLVTNPPYSKDHVLKLLDFVARRPEPHLLCMPSYVMVQPEYQCGLASTRGGQQYLALVPRSRYMYWTPKGLRGKDKTQNHSSSRGFRTSPFLSFWYVGLKPGGGGRGGSRGGNRGGHSDRGDGSDGGDGSGSGGGAGDGGGNGGVSFSEAFVRGCYDADGEGRDTGAQVCRRNALPQHYQRGM